MGYSKINGFLQIHSIEQCVKKEDVEMIQCTF